MKIEIIPADKKFEPLLDLYKPLPANKFLPEWYKKLDHTIRLKTVKGCMPFLDTLTTGYLLRVPQDYAFVHNMINKDVFKNKT